MGNKISLIEVQIKKFIESIRPPIEIRDKVDIGWKFEKNTLELFEIRPKWNDENQKNTYFLCKNSFHKYSADIKSLLDESKWKIGCLRTNSRSKNHFGFF
jgi:hypothetical protein